MTDQDTKDRRTNADSVIRTHMAWSMGAGLIPVPVADFLAVGAIQLSMVKQLSRLYDVRFKETEGKAIISSLTGSGLAKMGARAAVKFIPGVGSVVGGVTMAVLSGASTFALGEAFKKHFETGGTILDLDLNRLKKIYDEKFEKGKEVAMEMKEEKTGRKKQHEDLKREAAESDDLISRLKELGQLKKDGVITEEEFEKMKKSLIGD